MSFTIIITYYVNAYVCTPIAIGCKPKFRAIFYLKGVRGGRCVVLIVLFVCRLWAGERVDFVGVRGIARVVNIYTYLPIRANTIFNIYKNYLVWHRRLAFHRTIPVLARFVRDLTVINRNDQFIHVAKMNVV